MQTPDAAENKMLELRLASGMGLRVAFATIHDRIGHSVALVKHSAGGSAEVATLLTSREDSGTDPWPCSPPLQNLSIEQLAPDRWAALLVGMAGGSHWSASMEAKADQPALEFDIACRSSQTPQRLESCYFLAPEVCAVAVLSREPQTSLSFSVGHLRFVLMAEAAGNFPPPRLELHGNELRIVPTFDIAAGLKTIRWKYRLQLS